MLIDPSLNSVATVLANLHQSFYEAAVRCLEYARVLSKVRTTCSSLLISTSILSICSAEGFDAIAERVRGHPVRRSRTAMNDGQIQRVCVCCCCTGDHYHDGSAGGAALTNRFADAICRDGRQHYHASISDATAPFAFARQQRGHYCAERHLAPATSVVSVCGLP